MLRRRRAALYSCAGALISRRDSVIAGDDNVDIQPGNSLPLKFIPVGTVVHNVELKIGKGGQLVRSAGLGAQLMAKEGTYALLKLPSGELRHVLAECRATVGQVGNADQENISWGKAGRMRWLGFRRRDPRYRQKSGRSSAWRRRRTVQGQSSHDPVGQADQRL